VNGLIERFANNFREGCLYSRDQILSIHSCTISPVSRSTSKRPFHCADLISIPQPQISSIWISETLSPLSRICPRCRLDSSLFLVATLTSTASSTTKFINSSKPYIPHQPSTNSQEWGNVCHTLILPSILIPSCSKSHIETGDRC
jgi:hypothetical protein